MRQKQGEQAIDLIYAAAMGAADWDQVLRIATEFVGASSATIQPASTANDEAPLWVESAADLDLDEDATHLQRDGEPTSRPGLTNSLSFLLYQSADQNAPEDSAGRTFLLTMTKAPGQGPFTERELARLKLLAPHLQRAARLTCLRTIDQRSSFEALESLEIGAALLSHTGEIVVLNGYARRLLSQWPAMRLRNGRLEATSTQLRTDLDDLLRGALTATPRVGGEIVVPAVEGFCSVVISVTPVSRDNPFRAGPNLPSASVYFLPSERRPRRGVARVARLYQLTSAEASVLAALAAGQSPREIADARQTSLHTVKTQIKNLLHKADAPNLAILIAACNAFDLVSGD